MSNNTNDTEANTPAHPESGHSAVFKSSGVTVHRLNSATNSVVSDVAVSRGIEETPTGNSIDSEVAALSPPTAQSELDPLTAPPVLTSGDAEGVLEASLAKVEETVQSIEQRRVQIEETYQKAEAMLAEAHRISASLQLGDALRERIEATVARTRGLRTKQRE